MKSLIIICMMGLISVFDCKVDEEDVKNCIPVLGIELIDQDLWNDVGLAYWGIDNPGWSGDGVKLSGNNGVGILSKYGLGLVVGKTYRVSFYVNYVNGWFESRGFNRPGYLLQVQYGGNLGYDVVCLGDGFYVEASSFTGDVTSMSVKEITGWICN